MSKRLVWFTPDETSPVGGHIEEISPLGLARRFHETYERLAPSFGYKTREASAKPWTEVPDLNKALMIAVADEVIGPPSPNAPAPVPTPDGAA